MANKFPPGTTSDEVLPKPTLWATSVDEAWQTWLGVQTLRVIDNFSQAGYSIARVGTRPTKNVDVELWRAEVRYPKGHPRSIVRTNVQKLIRAVFPGIDTVDMYEPDEVQDGLCIAVWFAFDSKPLTTFK